jgi:SMI1-KNR4 cell-wall
MTDLVIEGRGFKVVSPGQKINEATITLFEEQIGVQLPQQLRDYYLRYNGGCPRPNDIPEMSSPALSLPWPNDFDEINDAQRRCPFTFVSWFFQIASEPSTDFFNAWSNLKNYIPQGMLAFSPDPGGDLFMIGTQAENLGKIFFWARSIDDGFRPGQRASPEGVSSVANSFYEFLLLLREEPKSGESFDAWVRRVYGTRNY